jgi:hypothetical protein
LDPEVGPRPLGSPARSGPLLTCGAAGRVPAKRTPGMP